MSVGKLRSVVVVRFRSDTKSPSELADDVKHYLADIEGVTGAFQVVSALVEYVQTEMEPDLALSARITAALKEGRATILAEGANPDEDTPLLGATKPAPTRRKKK